MVVMTDGIWGLTALGKAKCVLYGRNNEKDFGDQEELSGYLPLPLNTLEHTLGHLASSL